MKYQKFNNTSVIDYSTSEFLGSTQSIIENNRGGILRDKKEEVLAQTPQDYQTTVEYVLSN